MIALLLSLSLACAPATACEALPAAADEALPAAVAAYRDGNYAEAAEAFAQLAQAETDPARAALLHCNAGTAAARAERYGEAVWQLRRARMQAPRDAIARMNLERVQTLLGAPDAGTHSFSRTLLELPLRMTPDEIATACSLVAAFGFLLLALWRAGRSPRAERVPRAVLWLGLLLLAVGLGWWLLGRRAWEQQDRGAVVIPPTVSGRAEPDDHSEILFRLSGGSLVSDEEQRGDWRLVQSDAGARGWVPAADVRPLR